MAKSLAANEATLLALAQFASTSVAILAAELHHKGFIETKVIVHLQDLLARIESELPADRRPMFETLSATIGGSFYPSQQ